MPMGLVESPLIGQTTSNQRTPSDKLIVNQNFLSPKNRELHLLIGQTIANQRTLTQLAWHLGFADLVVNPAMSFADF